MAQFLFTLAWLIFYGPGGIDARGMQDVEAFAENMHQLLHSILIVDGEDADETSAEVVFVNHACFLPSNKKQSFLLDQDRSISICLRSADALFAHQFLQRIQAFIYLLAQAQVQSTLRFGLLDQHALLAVRGLKMQQIERVPQEFQLQVELQLCAGVEARASIHFDDPRFQLLIEEDIETEQFEADAFARRQRARPTRSIGSVHVWCGEKDGFQHDVLRAYREVVIGVL